MVIYSNNVVNGIFMGGMDKVVKRLVFPFSNKQNIITVKFDKKRQRQMLLKYLPLRV
ncbi:MAG: hypothetical protein ACOYN6_07945 [Ignavibacteria bacterium]